MRSKWQTNVPLERGNLGQSYEIETFELRTVLGLYSHCDGPGISPCHSLRVFLYFGHVRNNFASLRLGDDDVSSTLSSTYQQLDHLNLFIYSIIYTSRTLRRSSKCLKLYPDVNINTYSQLQIGWQKILRLCLKLST